MAHLPPFNLPYAQSAHGTNPHAQFPNGGPSVMGGHFSGTPHASSIATLSGMYPLANVGKEVTPHAVEVSNPSASWFSTVGNTGISTIIKVMMRTREDEDLKWVFNIFPLVSMSWANDVFVHNSITYNVPSPRAVSENVIGPGPTFTTATRMSRAKTLSYSTGMSLRSQYNPMAVDMLSYLAKLCQDGMKAEVVSLFFAQVMIAPNTPMILRDFDSGRKVSIRHVLKEFIQGFAAQNKAAYGYFDRCEARMNDRLNQLDIGPIDAVLVTPRQKEFLKNHTSAPNQDSLGVERSQQFKMAGDQGVTHYTVNMKMGPKDRRPVTYQVVETGEYILQPEDAYDWKGFSRYFQANKSHVFIGKHDLLEFIKNEYYDGTNKLVKKFAVKHLEDLGFKKDILDTKNDLIFKGESGTPLERDILAKVKDINKKFFPEEVKKAMFLEMARRGVDIERLMLAVDGGTVDHTRDATLIALHNCGKSVNDATADATFRKNFEDILNNSNQYGILLASVYQHVKNTIKFGTTTYAAVVGGADLSGRDNLILLKGLMARIDALPVVPATGSNVSGIALNYALHCYNNITLDKTGVELIIKHDLPFWYRLGAMFTQIVYGGTPVIGIHGGAKTGFIAVSDIQVNSADNLDSMQKKIVVDCKVAVVCNEPQAIVREDLALVTDVIREDSATFFKINQPGDLISDQYNPVKPSKNRMGTIIPIFAAWRMEDVRGEVFTPYGRIFSPSKLIEETRIAENDKLPLACLALIANRYQDKLKTYREKQNGAALFNQNDYQSFAFNHLVWPCPCIHYNNDGSKFEDTSTGLWGPEYYSSKGGLGRTADEMYGRASNDIRII